ncbi:MAG: ABC transporter permease [Capnocytophaga sp.]|nr:ABC transporter permease [Capnocytophaga sp.]
MKKFLHFLFTIWGVVSIIFFLFNILPGDPARMMLDQNENSEQLQIIKKKYGFDKPILTQYGYYLNDLSPISFHSTDKENYSFFNKEKYNGVKLFSIKKYEIYIKTPYLRESFQKNGKKVNEIIAETLPNTIILATVAICIATFLGIFLGSVSALYKDSWLDKSIQLISTLGVSIPSFFSAILFSWFFGFVLHSYTHLPMTGNLYEIDDYGTGKYLKISNLILPALALGVRPLAVVTQLMRNSLLEVLGKDYIRTAFAKGLNFKQVVFRHALKNSLSPVVTALSGWFAGMLAGAVFIEYIFGWNGIGKEMVNALQTLDLPVIMGAVLVISILFIFINMAVDIFYKMIDARIK